MIHVQLRDPRIQQATSLADLHVLPTDSEETRTDVTTRIKTCLGKGVLFVLDGWDEFVPGLRDGFVGTLIYNPHMVRLQHSTLLITSRPIASGDLQPYASSRVEIVGFTRGEVRQYFEEALGDPLAVQNLQGQLMLQLWLTFSWNETTLFLRPSMGCSRLSFVVVFVAI